MSRSVAFLGFSTSSFTSPKSGQQQNNNGQSRFLRRRKALFSFFKKSGKEGDEKNVVVEDGSSFDESSSSSEEEEGKSSSSLELVSLRRAISLSQSFCAIASTTGGFNNFELVPPTLFDDPDEVAFKVPATSTSRDIEERKLRLNQRPLWTEEDGYEREMRLATASFLAATTLAVGQPAVALDFVVVDPAGTQTSSLVFVGVVAGAHIFERKAHGDWKV